jgi:hypothetical protein
MVVGKGVDERDLNSDFIINAGAKKQRKSSIGAGFSQITKT